MSINKNHEFEDLDGIKCAIVERNISAERVQFLKSILIHNGYTVVIVPATNSVAKNTAGEATVTDEATQPQLFTLGVTDVTFNAINAIFGRALKTEERKIVTLAYWQQKDTTAHDDIPYFSDNSCMN